MNYKKILTDVLMVALFALISLAYFWQPTMDGTVLHGSDHNADAGLKREMNQYREEHGGERTRWTNTLFCGMPTYQIAPSYPSTTTLSKLQRLYELYLPTYASYVFLMLLGFYILLRAFDFRQWMAALGAILWAFSSYYFIIIAAGHIWKLYTLSFIPPTIAGVVLCYRGRYVWGLVVTGLFAALQILSNHVQMSYYFLPVMALMALAYLVEAWREKRMPHWLKATGAALLGGVLGVMVNASNLYHTYEYSKESMRGKSELTQKVKDAADQTDSGLERSYITAWSYGIDETWSLLIPNVKGGASVPLTHSEKAMEKADPQFRQVYQQLGQYWGDQPGTSGPVYVGAFVLFLFVLGLFIVRGPMKWALLAATVLSILLSWGKNFMPFTDFFLDYVPMYSKFRTVASILVIAEFTIPMLAMLALREVVSHSPHPIPPRGEGVGTISANASTTNHSFPSGKVRNGGCEKAGMGALLLTAGFCLLFALLPDLFFGDYLSMQEHQTFDTLTDYGWPVQTVAALLQNLHEMRRAVFVADCWRSFFVILVGFAVLYLYYIGKLREKMMVGSLALLCLVDMWGVNKRYLNDGMFVQPTRVEQAFRATDTDEEILEDSDLYYRVLNLSVSTFNDNTTSYYHKSIGGYHAAKLRRYQELVEEHLSPEMRRLLQTIGQTAGQLGECNGDSLFPVLNMLNMKYAIAPLKDGGTVPVLNPWANGNAWFVDEISYVQDADTEIKALHSLDTKHAAVADWSFQTVLGEATKDTTAITTLTQYGANELHYTVQNTKAGILVFSEVYYPGWTCLVDGKEVELGRVNYILRAARLAPGTHDVVLRFFPQTIQATETVAYAALCTLALLLLFSLALSWRRGK